jgi:plastocyanin
MYKRNTLWSLANFVLFSAIVLSACGPTATQVPTATEVHATHAPATDATTTEVLPTVMPEETLVFTADPSNLQPCAAFETAWLIETPIPVTVTAVPVPTNTPDTRPAPTEDRIGLPENYATDFKLLFVLDRPDRKLARAICGNDIAAQRKEGEPFAYGSVLLMISYIVKLDGDGKPVLDDKGHYIRQKLVTYHVMRKEKGFGEAYGEQRSGEWEFVAYKADGSYDSRPENTNFCAACHSGQGGESIDYAFRMNMLDDPDTALTGPAAGENEISIYLYNFQQPALEIKAGTTVTWINNDQAEHQIMAAVKDDQGHIVADPNELFASDVLPSVTIKPGSTFSFTFDKPGEYLYICTIHKNMLGKIIVTE